MKLQSEDEVWLKDYSKALRDRFPGLVKEVLVFGSKARGDATEQSDLDIIVVIQDGDWRRKRAIREPGYILSIGTEVVPSIIVYTVDEWEYRRRVQAPFYQTVTEEGGRIL